MDYRREGGIKGGPLQTLSRKLINVEKVGKYLTTFIFSTFTFKDFLSETYSINDIYTDMTYNTGKKQFRFQKKFK